MKKVVVNVPFKDRHTGKLLKADGKILEMTEERVQEIKEVNPNFITVVGNVEEKKDAKADGKKADAKADENKADE
jgi:uncharacterized membrane protein YukC